MSRPYTLVINRTASKCGHCGRNAIPDEDQHLSSPGYERDRPPGCGVRWVLVDTDYAGMEDSVAAMRPDLTPAWTEEKQT